MRGARLNNSGATADPHSLRRTIVGILAGGGLFLGIMLLLVGTAVALGLIRRDPSARVNLGPWLVLELAGGAPASVIAGMLSRRIARRYRAPLVLAACLFGLGLLEAAEILAETALGVVEAPIWLALLAPLITASGVLLGGWRPKNAGRQGG
jgi:hypothetical protein